MFVRFRWGFNLDKKEFKKCYGVSRETMDRLEKYVEVLTRWQGAINLIGPKTLTSVWRRHIHDSAQLISLFPNKTPIITDFGSGAGFPGLVLAIMTKAEVHLVESSEKKTQFLMEVARQTGTHVKVHQGRIENISPWKTDLITVRALGSLDKLLEYADCFGNCSGDNKPSILCLKGRRANEELTQALKSWKIDFSFIKSRSDETGIIVYIKNFSRYRFDKKLAK